MSKTRIALVLPGGVASGIDGNGIPLFLNFCKSLGETCELTVISLTKISDDFRAPNYKLYGLDLKHDAFILTKMRKFSKLFAKLHRQYKYEIVHGIWTAPAGLMAVKAANRYRLKSLVSLQGGDLVDHPIVTYGGNRGFLKKQLNNWILRQANALTAETNFQAQNLSKNSFKKKLRIINYGISPEEFPDYEKPTIGKPVRFIHVANLNIIKNQVFMIDVFASLQEKMECTLQIVGPDYFDGKVQQRVKELGLEQSVTFEGYQKFDFIKKALKNADAMLHFSHYESTGLSVIEAMASRVLVFGTDVGIMYDLKNEACVVSDKLKPTAFAEEIISVLNKPQKAEKLRNSAFNWTRSHTMQDCINAFKQQYLDLLDS